MVSRTSSDSVGGTDGGDRLPGHGVPGLPAHQGREVFSDAHQCAQALATADIPSDGDLSEDNGGIRAAEVARQSGHVPQQVQIDGVLHVASGREHGKFAAGVGQRRTRRGWNRSADDLDVGVCLGFLIMRSYWQRFGESYPPAGGISWRLSNA